MTGIANRKYDPDKVDSDKLHAAIRALPPQHTITLEGSGVAIRALGGAGGRRFMVQVPDGKTGRSPVRPQPYGSASHALEDAKKAHDDIKLGMGQ